MSIISSICADIANAVKDKWVKEFSEILLMEEESLKRAKLMTLKNKMRDYQFSE